MKFIQYRWEENGGEITIVEIKDKVEGNEIDILCLMRRTHRTKRTWMTHSTTLKR